MALSELTVNRHNIKRAELFAQHGLGNIDVMYAHPKFDRYGDGECALCGQKHLRWLFSLRFDAPQGLVALAKIETDLIRDSEVTLAPVGSKCINDWLDAIPDSQEKLDALKRWKREMDVCKGAMKAKVVEDLCRVAGYETPEAAFEAFQGTSWQQRRVLNWKHRRRFERNAYKVKHKNSSRKTVQDWLKDLATVLAQPQPVVAPVTQPVPPQPAPSQPTEADNLLQRGRAAWVNKDVLRDRQQNDFADIGKKVAKDGRFRSPAQQRYYTDMLKRLEA